MEAVVVRQAAKRYGTQVALDGLDLTVATGQVVAVLGPNGAGKTTLLEVLEGLRDLDQGEARVLGLDVRRDRRKLKERIGVSLQATAFFDRLTLRETLRLYGSFYRRGMPLTELLNWVGLSAQADARIVQLSGGQQQRAALALALVNNPDLVFLDEPTTGLDPGARQSIWKLVREMRRGGRTVVLSTHYMEEATALADHVVVVDQGRVLAEGTVPELVTAYGGDASLEVAGEGLEYLAEPPYGFAAKGGRWIRSSSSPPADTARILESVQHHGARLSHLAILPASLETVFLRLTGRELS
ncbi:MAG: ABC transporter ATP-binding protein [Thermaerobacter sp.]|nr:ABC transporter ATP-binding protein [Thermaerobacter sp.]